MNDDDDETTQQDAGGDANVIDDMLQHLETIKQQDSAPPRKTQKNRSLSKKAKLMQQRPDPAVLASNHEPRLAELVELPKVTHRAGRSWASVKIGLEAHGRLPIYYRLDGAVTHTGYITKMVIEPEDNSDVPQEIREHVTDEDTYSDYNDKYDTTTFLVTGGQQLNEPFPQSELELIEGGDYVDEDFSYQPAYVRQRDGDFPEF